LEWAFLYYTSSNAFLNGMLKANSGQFTNSLNLPFGTASTLLSLNGSKNAASIANGAGMLTNDGSGGFGFTTNLSQNIVINNATITNLTVQNNLTVSNLYTVNGNHNTLIVTNALTLNSLKTNLLAVTSTGLITNANYGSGITWTPSTLTLSASSGTTVSVNATNVTTPNIQDTATVTWAVSGSNVTATAVSSGGAAGWPPNTALTYSGGTNLTIALGPSQTNYYATLTNSTTFFVAPTGLPATTTTNLTFYLFLQQDSTGVRAVSWAGNFKWPSGVAPVITTNASAIDCIVFTTSPFTTTNLFGTWQPNFF